MSDSPPTIFVSAPGPVEPRIGRWSAEFLDPEEERSFQALHVPRDVRFLRLVYLITGVSFGADALYSLMSEGFLPWWRVVMVVLLFAASALMYLRPILASVDLGILVLGPAYLGMEAVRALHGGGFEGMTALTTLTVLVSALVTPSRLWWLALCETLNATVGLGAWVWVNPNPPSLQVAGNVLLLFATSMAIVFSLLNQLRRSQRIQHAQLGALEREVENRQRIEQSLREKQNLLESAQRIASLGFWHADMERGVLHLSKEVVRMFKDEALPEAGVEIAFADYLARYVHPDDLDHFQTQIVRSLEKPGDPEYVLDFEYRVRLGNGGLIWFAVTGGYLPGSRTLIVGVAEDTTERKRVMDELRQARDAAQSASRAKDHFLAIMSHELRTPLSGMLGLLRLLQGSGLDPQQRQWIEATLEAGQRQLRQLTDLLDLSRIEAGRLEINPEPCDLRALVEGCAAIFRGQAVEKGLEFAVAIDPALPAFVQLDPHRVGQVLSNLLNNAIRFTEAGGVTLEAGQEAGRLIFAVHDTGIGIAAAAQGRIFDPFVQVHATIRRQHGGSGLGLAICRQLAGLLGGQIQCRSTPGQGSSFRVELPLVAAEAPAPADAAPVRTLSKALAILLVEDEPLNRLAAKGLLEGMGHRVTAAASAAEALAACEEGRFDTVISDIHMPEMDGYELAVRLRQRPDGPPMTLVALTADLTAGANARAEGLFDAWLVKPFDATAFAALFGERRAVREANDYTHGATAEQALVLELDQGHLERTLAALPPEQCGPWLALAGDSLNAGVAAMRSQMIDGDHATLAKEAHRLVSAASIVGLVKLREIAKRIESAARLGETPDFISVEEIDELLRSGLLALEGAADEWSCR